jgi:23S rRNA (pseudouridine1915-N3)-methyltransferase
VNWKLFAVGKPKLLFAAAGIDEYTRRVLRFTKLEIVYIRSCSPDREAAEFIKRSERSLRIVLDERGSQLTSRQFADLIQKWEFNSVRQVSLFVGGAEGHGEEMRTQADLIFSLGQMTLQHELALLIICEQIYRAYTILAGAPYHREG